MNKKSLILIITAIFLLSGCSKYRISDTVKISEKQNTQVTAENTNSMESTKTAEATAAETAKTSTAETGQVQNTKASAEAYFGQYVIKKLLTYGPVSTYGSEDIDGLIGKRLSFSKEKASCFGEEVGSLNKTAENPAYKKEVISKADFESDSRVTFEKLGLKGDSITQVTAEDSMGNGSVFYIKDENTIILYGGGIYLELTREK